MATTFQRRLKKRGCGLVNPFTEYATPPTSNLWGWWKVDGGSYTDAGKTTLCTNTDTCYTLADISGNGRDLIQATAGSRPTYTTGALNSYASLVFDGTSDRLLRSTDNITNDMSVFIVFRNITWTSGDGIVSRGTSGTFCVQQDQVTPQVRLIGAGFDNGNLAVNTFGAMHAAWNTGTNACLLKINDTATLTGTFALDTTVGLSLGDREATGNYSNIEVLELMVYENTTITDGSATQIAVMNYLSTKFNLGWTL